MQASNPAPSFAVQPRGQEWHPRSWKSKPALQQPRYADSEGLERAVNQLAIQAPLVAARDVESLKMRLAEAARGDRFLVQGGPCAERFDDCNEASIHRTLALLRQLSLVFEIGLRRPVTAVGRLAGQYAKPRSSDVETRGDVSLPCYRGDMVNTLAFAEEERTPDPGRMMTAYARAAATLGISYRFRGCSSAARVKTARTGDSVTPIWRAWRPHFAGRSRSDPAGLFVSHEGLHLSYEEALTREASDGRGFYDLSTHLPWIGMRTADPDGAHVEYFRGIRNPIAIKVGPAMTPGVLAELLDRLHPDNEPGRLTLIQRFGTAKVHECLPRLIDTVQRSGKTVLWCCDPMHGNTEKTANGVKTRRFAEIFEEIRRSFAIHEAMGSRLGGLHLELTGDEVTECTGGSCGLSEGDLDRAYLSAVDPRLNPDQALELAIRVVMEGSLWRLGACRE